MIGSICHQVNAELREKERELQETVALLRSVTTERDQALHGFTSKTSQVRPHIPFDFHSFNREVNLSSLVYITQTWKGEITTIQGDAGRFIRGH